MIWEVSLSDAEYFTSMRIFRMFPTVRCHEDSTGIESIEMFQSKWEREGYATMRTIHLPFSLCSLSTEDFVSKCLNLGALDLQRWRVEFLPCKSKRQIRQTVVVFFRSLLRKMEVEERVEAKFIDALCVLQQRKRTVGYALQSCSHDLLGKIFRSLLNWRNAERSLAVDSVRIDSDANYSNLSPFIKSSKRHIGALAIWFCGAWPIPKELQKWH